VVQAEFGGTGPPIRIKEVFQNAVRSSQIARAGSGGRMRRQRIQPLWRSGSTFDAAINGTIGHPSDAPTLSHDAHRATYRWLTVEYQTVTIASCFECSSRRQPECGLPHKGRVCAAQPAKPFRRKHGDHSDNDPPPSPDLFVAPL
jgi:hypothetical protein